jgi:ubiquitin-protein ligase
VLKKLRQVLEEPSADGPLNATAGELLAKDAAKFKETAAKWTKDYAQ